jgi:hypothetical protein
VEDDKAGDEISHFFTTMVTPCGTALSDPEEAEALADSLESQFQPVNPRWIRQLLTRLPRRCKHTLMPLQVSLS